MGRDLGMIESGTHLSTKDETPYPVPQLQLGNQCYLLTVNFA